MTTGRIARRIE